MKSPPLCRAFVSMEQPECGAPAPFKVRVKNALTDAFVDLCGHHKAIHDQRAASKRSRGPRRGSASDAEQHQKAS